MKKLILPITLLATMLISSCSENAPDFIGVFEITQQDAECPSGTATFDAGPDGICIPTDNGQNCLYWKYEIFEDGTYTESRILKTVSGGFILSRPGTTEGTYTTLGNEITLTSASSGSTQKFQLNELETSLSGYLGEPLESGCRLFATLNKL